MNTLLENTVRKFCISNNLVFNSTCAYLSISKIHKSAVRSELIFNSCLINRNPRNLEKLRIARKPTGYHLDTPGKTFWHKIFIVQKARYVIARVCHNNGNTVIQATTNEWGLTKHLYRSKDVNAYINLAYVLAERCIQSGITEMINGVNGESHKVKEFIKHFEEAGIGLTEPPSYTPLTPWNRKVDVKPWKIH